MEGVRYRISDAAELVRMEAHVLRCWEDAFGLTIPRNEMGHRYYTNENIRQFWLIKNLKRQGYPMDAIGAILHGEGARYFYHTSAAQTDRRKEQQAVQEQIENRIDPNRDMEAARENPGNEHILPNVQGVLRRGVTEAYDSYAGEMRMQQLRELVGQIIVESLTQNKTTLMEAISQEVRELVGKEVDYQLRTRQEQQEDTIRASKVIGGPMHTGLRAIRPERLQKREQKKLEREQRRQAKRTP